MRSKALLIGMLATLPIFVGASNPTIEGLMDKCIPSSHHALIKKIVMVESNAHPYAININHKGYKSVFPSTKKEAMSVISELNRKGLNFDVGLAQINSYHFKIGEFRKRGYSAYDALDPCLNLKFGTYILSENYRRFRDVSKALSAYNTGHPEKGVANGYVEKVLSKE